MADLALAGWDVLGFDTVMPEYSVVQEAAALGAKVDWGDRDRMPDVKEFPKADFADIEIAVDFLEKPSCRVVLDAISISYLIMPILIPVLAAFKIDPLWYGVIFISALAIGQATPPVGVNLFTAANLVKGDLDAIAKQAILFVIMDVVVLIILSLFPILSLYLPVLAGLYTP